MESAGRTGDVVPVSEGGEGFFEDIGSANRTTMVTGSLEDQEHRRRVRGAGCPLPAAAASAILLQQRLISDGA